MKFEFEATPNAYKKNKARDLTVQYSRGHTYLKGFLGSGESKKEWMEDKIATWVATVDTMAKVAINYPQPVYDGFVFCLHGNILRASAQT